MALFTGPAPWQILGASAVATSVTGTLSETTLATVTIPGGAIGANGVVRVTMLWTYTNNANNKIWRLRLNGIGGTAIVGITRTTSAGDLDQRIIWNRNSQSSQVAFSSSTTPAFTNTAGAPLTAAIDTSTARDLVFTGNLANIADSITLESYLVEIAYRP